MLLIKKVISKISYLGIPLLLGPAFTNAVSHTDIAQDESYGLHYQRQTSPRISSLLNLRENGFTPPLSLLENPMKAHGSPGIALLDFDGDGDIDIYVTNGPGAANSLFSNQLSENGIFTFTDIADEAGVSLVEKDSTGVCYGDIDNDNDQDILVLSSANGYTLFENRANGKFSNITESAGISGEGLYSTSCSMGDINNDGLLDIVIANSFDSWDNMAPIFSAEAAARKQHNQLLVNTGDNQFVDVSNESGITNFKGISWAIALVDYDLDGDLDIVVGDDQGGVPNSAIGGEDVGYVRLYKNDGEGTFKDVTIESGTGRYGAWMGLSFGDFNSDNNMDIFATNVGTYMGRYMSNINPTNDVTHWNSGWFLSDGNGKFNFPNVGALIATPFGWGAVAVDYDNDSDTDVIFHGGMDLGYFVEGSNPGAVLENNGSAEFDYDSFALSSTDHNRRNVMGVANADLNGDGFTDLVSVSSHDWPKNEALTPIDGASDVEVFSPTAYIWQAFAANDLNDPFQGYTWSGIENLPGSLSVEINDANNNNKSVHITLKGSVGLVDNGIVNRDGIGAVIQFTPTNHKTAMAPVLSGGSYGSQSEVSKSFGLKNAKQGTIDILWPGGVRNRMYNVKAGSKVLFPEIPCSIDDTSMNYKTYKRCVKKSLRVLKAKNVINHHQKYILFSSSMRAFWEEKRYRYNNNK